MLKGQYVAMIFGGVVEFLRTQTKTSRFGYDRRDSGQKMARFWSSVITRSDCTTTFQKENKIDNTKARQRGLTVRKDEKKGLIHAEQRFAYMKGI